MSGPGALRAILQAARQHGIRRPREAFLATQSPAWQKAFGQSVVKEPQWHYGSFDVEKGNTRPNGPMHFGTYKASQDREHNVAFERLEREIRDDLMAEGFEPGPELDAQARREMSAQIENVGIPEHLFDDPQGVKRASYFLDIRNPMRVEDAQAVTERWAELEELARKQGHDALVYRNAVEDRGSDSYVPLNTRPQVKAVTAREFDMDDPDVHKAGGGLVKGLKAARKGLSAADPEALTPAARLRAADAQWSRSPSIIKAPGGNWLDGSVEKAVKGLRVRAGRNENRDPLPFVREPGLDAPEMPEVWRDPIRHPTPAEDVDYGDQHQVNALAASLFGPQEAQDALNSIALNRWIDKKLVGYIKNDMATERDPVRALAERGVTHAEMPHMPDEEHDGWLNLLKKRVGRDNIRTVGQSPLARNWEARSDTALDAGTAAFVVEGTPFFTSRKTPPEWLVELAAKNPNAPVYNAWHAITPDLGFDHLVDVLREQLATGVLTPQQLDKVTMANAVERAHAYNLEREAARKAAQLADLEAMTPYKQYDEGWRWVQLDKPGQFAAESDAMGHSVRGYEPPQGHADWDKASGKHGSLSYGHGGWDAIKSGRAKIYSLKGPDGKSYATVEVADRPSNEDAQGIPNRYLETALEQLSANDPHIEYRDPEAIDRLAAELYARDNPGELRITQIKGPSNRAPDKAALPYLQDFVRSGKWSDVRDLSNAQLRKRDDMFNELELKAYRDRTGEDMPLFPNREQANRLLEVLNTDPHYRYDDNLSLRADWETPP